MDLARFAAALDKPGEKPVLSLASQAPMYFRPDAPLGRNAKGDLSSTYYGLGWSVRTTGNESKANVWHNGAMPGTSTLLVRLANGRSWAMLFNTRADGTADDNIDKLLHDAAAKVTQWPTHDLFEK